MFSRACVGAVNVFRPASLHNQVSLISPTLILPTKDQFVSFHLLTEIWDSEFVQIINYRFVCTDTHDKYSSRVIESDKNLCFSSSILQSLGGSS